LVEDRRRLERELADAKKQLAMGGGKAESSTETLGSFKYVPLLLEGVDGKSLKGIAEKKLKEIGPGIVAVVSTGPSANTVVVATSDGLSLQSDSIDLVRVATAAMGGQGGGGRPDMAQGGGPGGKQRAQDAIQAIRQAILEDAE
jgi:alanyl-tRNA synthetase